MVMVGEQYTFPVSGISLLTVNIESDAIIFLAAKMILYGAL